MPIASCGLVDDQACAKYAHQQCKCDLYLDGEDARNKKTKEKFCKKLQVRETIECVHGSHVGARNNAIFLHDKKTYFPREKNSFV